jgi:hypothetical protein
MLIGTDIFNISTFNETTGQIKLSLNETHAGKYRINITVNDTEGVKDWGDFWIIVYDAPNVTSPLQESIFNLSENLNTYMNFTLNHSVADNLTVEFYMDNITCSYQNSSNCTYSNLTLMRTVNVSGNNYQYNWSFTPSYTDETYNLSKNLTLRVYPSTSLLNSTQIETLATNFTFKLNISHTNAPVSVIQNIPNPYPSTTYGASSPLTISLDSYFTDVDHLDSYYVQNSTFNITTGSTNSIIRVGSTDIANQLPWSGEVNGWSLRLYSLEAGSENITLVANDSLSSVINGPFLITFTAPSTTSVLVPSSGGGGSTIKYYSINLIVPGEIKVTNENYIEIPVTIQNSGQVSLSGINLSSIVSFNNLVTEDVKISLAETYIGDLQFGQSKDLTMTIYADTQKSGRYKVTLFANVTSPRFSDWAEFYIELQRANETDAENTLVFTEKLVAENPECLELTELIKEAQRYYDLGEYSNSLLKSQEAVDACEKAISSNQQVRYFGGKVGTAFYYIGFMAIMVFLAGFIFYIYKRVRFNKSKVNDYI